MRYRPVILIALLIGATMVSMGHAREPLELVDALDLERYQGRWYEIARLPNRFQDDCDSDVTAHYELRADGRVAVTNRCRRADGRRSEAEGVARRADPDGPAAALEVRFAPRWLSILPFVWGDYRVLALGEDYQYAMVGSESREYLWILARDPQLPEDRVERLIDKARAQGFNTGALIRTEHTP